MNNEAIPFEPFPKMARFSRDVIITEKIDGTNACIRIEQDGTFLTGSRTRWIIPGGDNFGFAAWAFAHKEELLKLGPGTHFGEWWGKGIQRGYGINEKRFSLFNTSRWSDPSSRPACCHCVPVIWMGSLDYAHVGVAESMERLKTLGSFAAQGFMKPEGIVVFHTAGNFGLKKTFEKDEGKFAA